MARTCTWQGWIAPTQILSAEAMHSMPAERLVRVDSLAACLIHGPPNRCAGAKRQGGVASDGVPRLERATAATPAVWAADDGVLEVCPLTHSHILLCHVANDASTIHRECFPLLHRHFSWLTTTQAGEAAGSFRWRGCGDRRCRVSGFDDYPRAVVREGVPT